MIVTNNRIETETCPQLFIGANLIEDVKRFKLLGFYIEIRLKYKAQIAYLTSKISQLCGVLFRLRIFF